MRKTKQELEVKEKRYRFSKKYTAGSVCAVSLAAYMLMKSGNYRLAILLYKKGGGGVNFYQLQPNGKLHRCFAIDYHPFWNKNTKKSEWKLHYHRGKDYQQVKKHRPYDGGW